MKPFFKDLKTFFCLVCLAGTASAQTINSHTFSFSDTLETVQIEDALGPKSELAQHRLLLRSSYDFVDQALIAIDPTRTQERFSVVDRLHSISSGAGYLLTKRLLIGFELPVEYVRLGSTYLSNTGSGIDSTKWVLGDLTAHLKFRLTGDDSPINFAIMPYGIFPTGNKNYFVSDDSYGFGGKLLADTTIFKILSIYANAGYTYAKNAQFLNIDRSRRVELALGAYVRVFGDFFGVNGEVINSITAPDYRKDQDPIAMRLGFRLKTGLLHWYFGGAFEGLQNARSNDVSLYGGIKMPFGSWKEKPVAVAPAPEPIAAPAPAPVPVPEEIVILKKIEILKQNLSVRREINFQTNKAIILPSSFEELDSAAKIIKENEQYIGKIDIEGHTDSRGSDAANMILSQKRAESVKAYLVGKGISADKLNAIGYGETRLKVKETGPESMLINRRVEFKVNEMIQTQHEIQETKVEEPKAN